VRNSKINTEKNGKTAKANKYRNRPSHELVSGYRVACTTELDYVCLEEWEEAKLNDRRREKLYD